MTQDVQVGQTAFREFFQVQESPRVINRGPNPYAAVIKNKNKNLSGSKQNVYEDLETRAMKNFQHSSIQEALDNLKERLNGKVYEQHHFGRLALVPSGLIDINIDIQRLIETEHVAEHIIELFDPRIMQPVNVIYIKETGRYSAWEGQQSSSAFVLMRAFGLIADDVLIQCKIVDDDLEVPGSDIKGEAVGNYGFRCINGKGRKTPDVYYTYRSMLNGVRLYGSTLDEDVQVDRIQCTLESNNMYPSADKKGRNAQQSPGEISYVSGIMSISNHGADEETFVGGLEDLNWALSWHNRYFAGENGVDNGFILAFSRFHKQARDNNFKITKELEDDFYRHMRAMYLTPSGFHKDCKDRLKKWQKANNLAVSWSDSCLLPIFVLDYLANDPKCSIFSVLNMPTYSGV